MVMYEGPGSRKERRLSFTHIGDLFASHGPPECACHRMRVVSTAKKTAQKRRQPLRTLPLPAIEPISGESLTSWIGALAQQQELEMKVLLRELHLDRLGGLSGAEMRISSPVVRRMEEMTGIDAGHLHAMT